MAPPVRGGRLGAALAILLAASGVGADPSGPLRALVDDEGATVLVPPQPRRIVALAPDLAETLVDVGAGGALVGACVECDRPGLVAQLPRVGSMVQPSIESILLLEPDLVVATSNGNPREAVARLRGLGVPVFGLAAGGRGLAGVLAQVRALGRLSGHAEEGDRLAGELEAGVDAARRRSAGRPRIRACVLVWTAPLVAAGRESFVADLLDAAGADNACERGAAEYPRLAREDLLLARPDLVLVATGEGRPGMPADLGSWSASMPAAASGRVTHVDPDVVLRPTRRLLEALADMERRAAECSGDRP